mgnify:FL=1
MQFFDNDIVRSQSAELMSTYEDLQTLISSHKLRTKEGTELYLKKMFRLLELQEMLYFRATYSEEGDAKEYIKIINKTFPLVALEDETDPFQTFRRMKSELMKLKEQAEKS